MTDTLAELGLREDANLEMGEGEFTRPDLRFQLVSSGFTGVKFLQGDIVDPVDFPPPVLGFEPPWNYVPSMPSTLARPSPRPVVFVVKKGSKIRPTVSASMPWPVSETFRYT